MSRGVVRILITYKVGIEGLPVYAVQTQSRAKVGSEAHWERVWL